MKREELFQRRALLGLSVVAALSLLLSAVLALDPPAPRNKASVPGAGSSAATGHRALLRLLKELKIPATAGPGAWEGHGVLVVVDPDLDPERPETLQRFARLLLGAERVLVILPKWAGSPDPDHPGWLREVRMVGTSQPITILEALGIDGELRRSDGSDELSGPLHAGRAALEAPQLVSTNDLVPLIGGDRGLLIGERVGSHQHLLLVTDADLLSNQGLKRGDNARIVVASIERLRNGEGEVVFEESLLPGQRRGTLPGLLRFPLVLAVLQLLLLAAFALWAGAHRFGAPQPDPDEIPRGTAALIDGAVALQRLAGQPQQALRALLGTAVQEVSHRLHAPAIEGRALESWLDSLAVARRQPATLQALRGQVHEAAGAAAVLATARAVQRWREAMLHGLE